MCHSLRVIALAFWKHVLKMMKLVPQYLIAIAWVCCTVPSGVIPKLGGAEQELSGCAIFLSHLMTEYLNLLYCHADFQVMLLPVCLDSWQEHLLVSFFPLSCSI